MLRSNQQPQINQSAPYPEVPASTATAIDPYITNNLPELRDSDELEEEVDKDQLGKARVAHTRVLMSMYKDEPLVTEYTSQFYVEYEPEEWSSDAYSRYLQEMRSWPLLSTEQERILLEQFDQGLTWFIEHPYDVPTAQQQRLLMLAVASRQVLFACNQALVVSIAKEYPTFPTLSRIDLVNDGNEGLGIAIARFDRSQANKLSTYATRWIDSKIRRSIANNSRTVRLPVHRHDEWLRQRRKISALRATIGREPTLQQVAEALNATPEHVVNLERVGRGDTLSIQTLAKNEHSDVVISEERLTSSLIAQNDNVSQRQNVAAIIDSIYDPNTGLTPREREALELYFGVLDGVPRVQEAVGQDMRVSRARAGQLIAKGIRKLRARMGVLVGDELVSA